MKKYIEDLQKEELFEAYEIYVPTSEKGGEVYDFQNKRHLKLAAFLVDGIVVKIGDGVVVERRMMNAFQREEAHRYAAEKAAQVPSTPKEDTV